MNHRRSQSAGTSGFSLIELVVVVMIMTILAGVIIPAVADRQALARDARRLTDMRTLQNAIEAYCLDTGDYPVVENAGVWDDSSNGKLIPELVDSGYIREPILDPINDATYQYKYFVYSNGSSGCVGDKKFYVLGILNFEVASTATENSGYFKCTGRDWSLEFDYVTGGGASLK